MLDSVSTTQIVVFMSMLFVSISLHEMMHALVAYRLGDDLAHSQGRISLNPLKHIDPILTLALPMLLLIAGQPPILAAKPVPINTNRVSGGEMGLATIGIAGPVTNLLLATLAAIVIKITGVSSDTVVDMLTLFVQLNVGLFVFNMMPFPPLDGSRLLYAFAPSSIQRVMEQIESMGIFFVLIVLFFLLPVLSPVLNSVNTFFLEILL